MLIQVKLKSKEWFEENAYIDSMGCYWESLETNQDMSFLEYRLNDGNIESGIYYLTSGDPTKWMWACDDDFVAEHPQYFV